MLKKSLAFIAIAAMLASPLAFAQTAPTPTSSTTTNASSEDNVTSGGAAPGGLSGALGASNTAMVVGTTGFILLGIAIHSADSSGSSGTTGTTGTTGTN